MALVAATVLTETRALLNDYNGAIYPDQAILPFLDKAYRELQTRLAAYGYSAGRELAIPIPVPVGTSTLADGAGLPPDFLLPVELSERDAGSADHYYPMTEGLWESDEKKQNALRFWVWREEVIHFIGALTPREVLLKYKKALPAILEPTSSILIFNSQTWLAQRTAALAALLIGSNPSRSNALMDDLNGQQGPWEDLKQTLVHRMQSIPVRRRRTRWRKR